MNSPLVRWLLDLDLLPEDAGPLRLAWERGLPAWMWLLIVLGAAALAWIAYRRMAGPRTWRAGLAGLRTLTILLVIALLAGPQAELPRVDIERDWLLVLVDRSRSMTIADADALAVGADTGAGSTVAGAAGSDPLRRTRDQQARDAFAAAADELQAVADEKDIRWFGFHEGVFTLQATADGGASGSSNAAASDAANSANLANSANAANSAGPQPDALPIIPSFGPASGSRTDIGRAIDQSLQRAGGRPISAVLLLSDGRSTRTVDPAIARRLRADGVQLFTVPLGAAEPIGDLSVGRLDAPSRAFVRDKVPVRVDLERLGPALQDSGATVRLIDESTGEELASERLEAGSDRDRLTLVAEPEVAGETSWSVVIEPDRPDLVPDNNRIAFPVELIDREMRVLFVDGYPRWEYRYLKNLLIREASIESSNFLVTADRDFAQEGNAPITRLPRSMEEFEPFDVMVIGDVPAGFFSPEQMELMRDHVAESGAGVLWIGGPESMPSTYADSVLADLMPFRGGLRLPAIGSPVTMQPTPLAERLGVLQLVIGDEQGWPEALIDPSTGWSQLYYAQRIGLDQMKPTAEALATTVQTFDGAPLPLLMSMRFGAGQSIYVATDEIWRWRYGRGELLPDQFWIQMVRMLARERLAASGVRAVLNANPSRGQTGRPVRLSLRVLDAQLTDERRSSVAAEIVDADGQVRSRAELVRDGDSGDAFATTWIPDAAGEYTVRISERAFDGLGLAAAVSIREPADELLQPETDHDLLARLASETGGRVVAPDELGATLETLPNRQVRTENPLRESIWDTPLAFLLLLLLLGLEWAGRRMLRLA
ncbi:MAG: hypothetical protein AB8G96_01835 [Phycisphaerales bacterium]